MRAVASARARASWATGATRVERRRVRARAGKTASGGYEARNEFVIPSGDGAVVKRFEEEMALRVRVAKECGASAVALVKLRANEYAFEQTWASKEAYEAYMNTPARRRSHLTVGVYQRLPKDKWSVPENFTPLLW
ncbi:unnamed product [Ostreococcus tauri]|uniref:Unnamed product n=1 Tax=Ostreococcus tauri TaxID=70448 RepID=Q01CH7_OSTTA|nr:unnamed product [Ostreococcus tauri]CAL52976.1 unnamed product [Ostreococcus tauri]|eukprot:XP_003078236.1 unnamed product [Ostreococcus tauri]